MADAQGMNFAALQARYAAGATPQDIVHEVYQRIAEAADPGIFLHLRTVEQVLAEAAALPPRSANQPLWGIPFAIKDNIDFAGAPTTAACPAYGYSPGADAFVVAELRAAETADLDAAGEANANRGSGRGAAWNFLVSGTGTVIEAKLDSRARALSLDTDNDGAADLTLQLGPVIRGTALRDAAPFYDFDEFRDQIEFAKLSRALNDRIPDLVTVPEGDLIGTSVSFIGVVPLKKADEKMMVMPIEVTFGS